MNNIAYNKAQIRLKYKRRKIVKNVFRGFSLVILGLILIAVGA